jgi:hypothetical protein
MWRFEGTLPPVALTAGDLADAVLRLRATDYRYGAPLEAAADGVRIAASGPHGQERLTLRQVDGRWVALQAHRDVPAFVEIPPLLQALLEDG